MSQPRTRRWRGSIRVREADAVLKLPSGGDTSIRGWYFGMGFCASVITHRTREKTSIYLASVKLN